MMNKTMMTMLTFSGMAMAGMSVTASADSQYTVQAGDTLSSIAANFNTTVASLAEANDIANIHEIFVGKQLTIDGSVVTTAPVAKPANSVATTVANAVEAPKPVMSVKQPTQAVASEAVANPVATPVAPTRAAAPVKVATQAPGASGSTYDQFIAAGGSAAMWHAIVMPESTGNPNAVSASGYRGLGQTKEAWGTGTVAQQTQGMLNYASSRYGSVEGALAFRAANGWW